MTVRPIDSREEADRLIQEHFLPGVRTNHFPAPGETQAEIAAGALWASSWPGGLAFFHRKAGYWRLTFYLNDLSAPFTGELPPGVTAAEIAHKPGAGHEDTEFWLRAGFAMEGRRIRMRRRREDPFRPSGWPVRRSDSRDLEGIRTLLKARFHPYLGCIPEGEELERMAAEGEFFVAPDETGGVGGILGQRRDGPRMLLRHLAVRPELSGRGIGYDLMAAGLRDETRRDSLFWTAEGDTPARHVYRKLLAEPDGWQSDLLLYDPGTERILP